MSLRAKVFFLIGGVFTVFFFLMDISLSRVLTKDFSDLEEREMKENIFRATDALNSKAEELSIKLSDWAQWDDTYEYVQNLNDEYIESNLLPEGFAPIRINFIVFFNKERNLVFDRFVIDGKEVVFPKDLEDHLAEDVVSGQIDMRNIHKEFVNLPEGLMVAAAHPITSSDGLSEPNGIIIFGYILTETRVQELAQLTHLKLSVSLHGDDTSDPGFIEARENLSPDTPFFIGKLRSAETLSGYALVSDIENNPAFVLRIDTNREIYQRGQASVSLFGKLLVFSGIVFAAVVFFVLKRFVLNKISYLSKEVIRVRQGGNSDVHIQLPGRDEFSLLAEEIDSMLISIREIESMRKESEKRFRTVADAAPVMIWISDIEKKLTYVNKVWLDFTGRPLDKELGYGWEENIHPDDKERRKLSFETAFNRRAEFHAEYRLRGADGEYRWIFVRGVPQFSASGKEFIGYIGSCVDITERRAVDEKKEEYIEEIERMNKIMVSRELKMIELKEKIRDLENRGKQ